MHNLTLDNTKMFYSFAESQFDTLSRYLYGESCYFEFDEASEFSPYIKKLFCYKYFLWDDAIYTLIIVALSALIIQMIYAEVKADEDVLVIKNNLNQSKCDELSNENDALKDELQTIYANSVLTFNNKLIYFETGFKALVDTLKNELNDVQTINEELVNDNDALKLKLNKLQAIYAESATENKLNELQNINEELLIKNDTLINKLNNLQNDYNNLNRQYLNIIVANNTDEKYWGVKYNNLT
jgi:hypothetical protein